MRFPLNIFHALDRAWEDAKTRPRGAILLLLIVVAFIVLYVSLVHYSVLALGCIIILAGVLFPVFLEKWKAGFSFLLVLIGSTLILQQQEWFRGFFKANFISVFSSQMTRYGNQFESLTLASQTMYNELEANRIKMLETQTTIDLQQKHIDEINTHSELLLKDVSKKQELVDSTISNFELKVTQQQSDIQNVNDLLRNLLVRKTETFTFGDTNRVLFIEKEDGAVYAIMCLEAESIPGFIDVTFRNILETGNQLIQITNNIYAMVLGQTAFEQSVRPHGIITKYVADPVKTNVTHWKYVESNLIEINGIRHTFTGQKRYILPDQTNELDGVAQ